MKLPVGTGTEFVIFLESAAKVLTAVVTRPKSDICDGERTVREEKNGLLQATAVDVIGDGAVHVFGEQGLQIGFVYSRVCGELWDTDFFRKVIGYVGAGFFQVGHAGSPVLLGDAGGKLQQGSLKQETEQILMVGGGNRFRF